MIEFYLDTKSGIAPYLQLVHQVRRALNLARSARATSSQRSARS